MEYQLLTRTGKSFYEVTSAMQNAIRKGDYEVAGYAMWELIPKYTPYLMKRLLVISAEDCFGVITKEILKLTSLGTEEALAKALSLMCLCKKNRDADYFVCNLMFSNEDDTGLDKDALAQQLHLAIRKKQIKRTGYLSEELFRKNRKKMWNMLEETAKAFYPHLSSEIAALRESNERVSKPNAETIFAAKAIILMWTERENRSELLGYSEMNFDETMKYEDVPIIKPLDECEKINGLFPEWAYNWHTTYGKYTLKRDAVHAINNDQKLLTPLEMNLFDECSWNRDINACLAKHNPNRYPLPYNDKKKDPYERFS